MLLRVREIIEGIDSFAPSHHVVIGITQACRLAALIGESADWRYRWT